MIVTEDPDLRSQMLSLLSEEYQMDGADRRGTHHVGELIYCLTKSYRKRTEPLPPTDDEVGLWGIGFAMERVLLQRLKVEPITVDGITGSIDFLFPDGTPGDLKTTRSSPTGRKGEGGYQIPEGWKRQFMAYRYMLNRWAEQEMRPEFMDAGGGHSFGVLIIHLIQAEVKAYRLQFSDEEMESNWQWILDRSSQLENMLATGDSRPFETNEEWECKNCSYSLRCGLEASLKGMRQQDE